jgi:hypothetical protein
LHEAGCLGSTGMQSTPSEQSNTAAASVSASPVSSATSTQEMTTRDRVLCWARLQDVRLPYIPAQSAIPSALHLFLNFSMLL